LEGDLTLQVLSEAVYSGKLLDIDPFERKSPLKLNGLLEYINRQRNKEFYQHELLTNLVSQLCMAVANREAYREVSSQTATILDCLRDAVLPGNKFTKHTATDEMQDLIHLWEAYHKTTAAEVNRAWAKANKLK
jgi:hypothetical protein